MTQECRQARGRVEDLATSGIWGERIVGLPEEAKVMTRAQERPEHGVTDGSATAERGRRPRILLAEDHELVSQGLISMLSGRYDIAGAVCDGRDVVPETLQTQPDVLLLDLSLPGRSGVDLLPEILRTCPGTRVLIVSMHVDSHLVDMTMRLGASGFVPKNAALDELVDAIETVLAGEHYLSARLSRRSQHGNTAEPMGFCLLTRRQQDIVRLMAMGMTSGQIAHALGVSAWTVHFHRKNIRRALGVHSDLEMYRYAVLVGAASDESRRGA